MLTCKDLQDLRIAVIDWDSCLWYKQIYCLYTIIAPFRFSTCGVGLGKIHQFFNPKVLEKAQIIKNSTKSVLDKRSTVNIFSFISYLIPKFSKLRGNQTSLYLGFIKHFTLTGSQLFLFLNRLTVLFYCFIRSFLPGWFITVTVSGQIFKFLCVYPVSYCLVLVFSFIFLKMIPNWSIPQPQGDLQFVLSGYTNLLVNNLYSQGFY